MAFKSSDGGYPAPAAGAAAVLQGQPTLLAVGRVERITVSAGIEN
jgi:hypothetical protein